MTEAERQEKAKRVIRAYRDLFRSPTGQLILEDLAKFCRANKTCFHQDARMHAVAEGRREVWLRIAKFINLNLDELFRLHAGQDIPQAQEDEEL